MGFQIFLGWKLSEECTFNCTQSLSVAVDIQQAIFLYLCTQFVAQNAGNHISELSDFKPFCGTMPPDPPRLLIQPATQLKPAAYFKFY